MRIDNFKSIKRLVFIRSLVIRYSWLYSFIGWFIVFFTVGGKLEELEMKRILCMAVMALVCVGVQADVDLINDDFSSGSVATSARFYSNQNGLGWYKYSTSLWSISGGVLSNAGTEAGVPSEGAVGQGLSTLGLATNYPKISVSFDYSVGTGSTLYFHLRGLTENGTISANEMLGNTGAQNGSMQNQCEDNYGDMSLLDGTDPLNSTEGTVSFAGGTSGTYTATFDLTLYVWHDDELPGLSGNITDLTDFDIIEAVFASNVANTDGTGVITIDNLKVTAIAGGPRLGLFMVTGN
jgi:hypothetical protein